MQTITKNDSKLVTFASIMDNAKYIRLSQNQVNKIGNALIYFSRRIQGLSKTKALKLIYILDEMAIKKSGIPFFNLKYKVWKFGPVSEEIFIDLSSELTIFKEFIKKDSHEGSVYIAPLKDFNDDEFSDNDLELMDLVLDIFGDKSAKELISYTHRPNAPWEQTAKENSVLELLWNEEITNTDILIDMGKLVAHDIRKK